MRLQGEDLPERQLPCYQSCLHCRGPDLRSEFQLPVRPDKVVEAAKQFEVIFETLLPPRMANRPPSQICRPLSDREIQPFNEGRVQFRRVLGISQHLLQSPRSPEHCSSLDLQNTIVSTRLDYLSIQTSRSKDTADDLRIKGESVCGDQRDPIQFHTAGDIPEEGQRVSMASSSHDCRRPKPRPYLDCCKDPERLMLVVDDGANLIGLKLTDGVSA